MRVATGTKGEMQGSAGKGKRIVGRGGGGGWAENGDQHVAQLSYNRGLTEARSGQG